MKNIPQKIGPLFLSGLLIAMPFATQAASFVGGPITFNDTTTSVPYPSSIVVSGLGASLSSITLTLTNFTRCDDLDMLLVGPTGATLIVFSDVGGLGGNAAITITLSDLAGSFLPDTTTLSGGTFKPTNEGAAQDIFAGPAPGGTYGDPGGATHPGPNTFASQFNGTNPNGTWSLYIADDVVQGDGETGSITGWTLDVTAVPEPSTWALLIAGSAALIFFSRRRRVQ
jgi:PEP-CTERM motif